MLKKKLRNQKGFTLIEIIAVLVILGILAAVAIPKFFGMQDEARKKSAQAGVAAIQSGLSLAYASYLMGQTGEACNVNPGAAAGCVELSSGYGTPLIGGGTAAWTTAKTTRVTISLNYDGGEAATGSWRAP
jgi:MSHA pilin protein MshA